LISILILTRNEEQDLPGCLESVSWCDDIHILDSYSTDNTVKVGEEWGATITSRKFDDFASQRNYGLRQISYKYDWILILDADERVPNDLVSEVRQFIQTAPEHVSACRIRRRDYWGLRWLKHAQISPFFIRLVRPSRVHYEREINEVLVVDGETQDLKSYFDHHPFSKGMAHWISKHNQYSDLESKLIASGSVLKPSYKIAFFGDDFNERRMHQKAVFYRLPGRPLIKFIYMFFIRRSFLDGWPGIRYTLLQCMYEYFIVLKTREMVERRREFCRNR
jgi:glycosyltransferase involved in cell wall biosynthesis